MSALLPLRRLARGDDLADLDARAIVRAIKSYEGGQDDAVITALSRLLEDPRLRQTSGLSDGLVRLANLGRPDLTAAACDALTELWNHALAPLSGAELQRAARASRTLDAAEPHHRITWALASDAQETFRALAPRITPDTWEEHVDPALRRLPHDALQHALITLQEEAPEPIRTLSLGLLDEDSDPAILEPLARSLPDSSSDYLTALAHALGRVNRVEAEPILLSILLQHSKGEDEEHAALDVLSSRGHMGSVRMLRQLLELTTPPAELAARIQTTIAATEARGLERPTHEHNEHTSTGGSPPNRPRPTASFWITWPLLASRPAPFLHGALFIAIPSALVMKSYLNVRGTALPMSSVAQSLYYLLPASTLIVVSYALYSARRWRKRGWFECISKGSWASADLDRVAPPRLLRSMRSHINQLSWVDDEGVTHRTLRNPIECFGRDAKEDITPDAPFDILFAEGHALILNMDTPFYCSAGGELRLEPFWKSVLIGHVLSTLALLIFVFATAAMGP